MIGLTYLDVEPFHISSNVSHLTFMEVTFRDDSSPTDGNLELSFEANEGEVKLLEVAAACAASPLAKKHVTDVGILARSAQKAIELWEQLNSSPPAAPLPHPPHPSPPLDEDDEDLEV